MRKSIIDTGLVTEKIKVVVKKNLKDLALGKDSFATPKQKDIRRKNKC